MSERHDARERAVICQDCWFWKELACALDNPVNGVCANKRPVQGRRAGSKQLRQVPDQAPLIPLAAGHAAADQRVDVAAQRPSAAPQQAPFATDSPESTFSMAQVRERTVAPPSFREIRADRAAAAAAAARIPASTVNIPIDEVESGTLIADAARHASSSMISPAAASVLPGMDQLVERVRRRTAERLARNGR